MKPPSKPAAIRCSACGAEALLVRTPRYDDGFKKVGETLKCSSCGHEYAREEDVPFQAVSKPRVFDESDALKKVEIFQESEKGRFCHYCRHYVVNPFTQRCSRHGKEVEATDVCGDFEAEPETPPKP